MFLDICITACVLCTCVHALCFLHLQSAVFVEREKAVTKVLLFTIHLFTPVFVVCLLINSDLHNIDQNFKNRNQILEQLFFSLLKQYVCMCGLC